jgi:hypothetical protein
MSDTYINPNQVQYDPKIDPNNLEQYTSKDYSVKAVYHKIPNPETDKDLKSLPNYNDFFVENLQDPLPPYEEFIIDNNNNNNNNSKRDKKMFKFAIHFGAFILIILLIQLFLNPLGCLNNYDDDNENNNNMMNNNNNNMMMMNNNMNKHMNENINQNNEYIDNEDCNDRMFDNQDY